jgi:hypothetical protein
VIAVHRMLKNGVRVPEYVLMSEPLYQRSEEEVRAAALAIEEDLEGLGSETLHFVDLERFALDRPPPPQPSLGRRLRATTGLAMRGFPVVAGLRRPRQPRPG